MTSIFFRKKHVKNNNNNESKFKDWSIEDEYKNYILESEVIIKDNESDKLLKELLDMNEEKIKELGIEFKSPMNIIISIRKENLNKGKFKKESDTIYSIIKFLGNRIDSINVEIFKENNKVERYTSSQSFFSNVYNTINIDNLFKAIQTIESLSNVIIKYPNLIEKRYNQIKKEKEEEDQDFSYNDFDCYDYGYGDEISEFEIIYHGKRRGRPSKETNFDNMVYNGSPKKVIKKSDFVDGVKKITFKRIRDPIGIGIIPESVDYIIIKELDICLSLIRFPEKLKFLKVQSIGVPYIFKELPLHLTHLDIDGIQKIPLTKGVIPNHITHIKMYIGGKIILPETIQFCNRNQNIKFINEKEYYKTILSSIGSIESLKYIKPNPFSQITFSQLTHLQSLDISGFESNFDVNQLPHSLTSLICKSLEMVPDHAQLCYLKYSIQTLQEMEDPILILSSNTRTITKNNIPHLFDSDTGKFMPQPLIPIDEFHIQSATLVSDVIIRKIKTDTAMQIPDGVEIYESLQLPTNYPKSLKQIILREKEEKNPFLIYHPNEKDLSKYRYNFNSIPLPIKQLSFFVDFKNINIFIKSNLDLLKDRYSIIQNHSNVITKTRFLQIWRNKYLRSKIYSFMQPHLIDHFHGGRYTGTSNQLKISYFLLPDSIPKETTYLSVRREVEDRINLPSSVTKLKGRFHISCVSDSIKHLVLTRPSNLRYLPSTVKILEYKFDERYSSSDGLFRQIPSTVKEFRLNTMVLSAESIVNQSNLTFLKSSNLLKDGQNYEIYVPHVPISNKTTVLIWHLNQMIPNGIIPSNVKRLILGNQFNQTILENSIPNSVTEISFGTGFKQCLSTIYLPSSLKYLSFSYYQHPIVPHSIPFSVKHIHFKSFNRQFYSSLVHLPKSIHYININRERFKQDYDNSSSRLKVQSIYFNPDEEILKIISIINSGIDNDQVVFQSPPPTTEINLEIRGITHWLPGSLDHMNIKSIKFEEFDQCLSKGLIPDSVTKIEFSTFNQQIFVPPPLLEYLDFGDRFNQELKSTMLPNSLTELHLSQKFNKPIPMSILQRPALKILHFGKEFKQSFKVGFIPNTVEQIYLYQHPQKDVLSFLPSSVIRLYLNFNEYPIDLIKSIPQSVKELVIDSGEKDTTEQLIPANQIPNSISKLIIKNKNVFIQDIDQLPSNVKVLEIDYNMFSGIIPSTVEHVDILNY